MSRKVNHVVYKITNIETFQVYIGVDTYFPKRLLQHISLLRNNKHRNKYLQSSFNKYGEEKFTFEFLWQCFSREEMLVAEKEYIIFYDSLNTGFNHTSGGEGSYGYKHSTESLQKMSLWKRNITPEWKENISKSLQGIKKKPYKRVNHPDYSKWVGGEKHPVAKLSFNHVCSIRLRYLQGCKQKDLAKVFNVNKMTINVIVTHKNWKDENYEYIKSSDFRIRSKKVEELKEYLLNHIK